MSARNLYMERMANSTKKRYTAWIREDHFHFRWVLTEPAVTVSLVGKFTKI